MTRKRVTQKTRERLLLEELEARRADELELLKIMNRILAVLIAKRKEGT